MPLTLLGSMAVWFAEHKMDFDTLSKIGVTLLTFGGAVFGIAKWFAHSDIASAKIERMEKSLGNMNMINRDTELHTRAIDKLEKDATDCQKTQMSHDHRLSDLEKKVTILFTFHNEKDKK